MDVLLMLMRWLAYGVRIGKWKRTMPGGSIAGQPDPAICPKKTPAQGGRQVIEAGFIQARNLSSSDPCIKN
jgi:hypothetical protein